jgi:hypothetical protein
MEINDAQDLVFKDYMKVLKGIFISLIFIVIAWTAINFIFFGNSEFEKLGSFTLNKNDAIRNKCILATYAANISGVFQTIRIERIQIRLRRTHLFYMPKYYSDAFYINPNSVPPNTKFILIDNDTMMQNGVRPFMSLPKKLIVHSNNINCPITYYLYEKYQENINNVTSVSFISKIDSGPLLNDDFD